MVSETLKTEGGRSRTRTTSKSKSRTTSKVARTSPMSQAKPTSESQRTLQTAQTVEDAVEGVAEMIKEVSQAFASGLHMLDTKRRIDFVLVYERSEKNDKKREDGRKVYQENLTMQGLELEEETVTVGSKSLTFVKIHAPWEALCERAEDMELKLPLRIRDYDKQAFEKKRATWRKAFDRINEFVERQQGLSLALAPDADMSPITINRPFKMKYAQRFALTTIPFFADRQRIEVVWTVLQTTPMSTDQMQDKRGVETLLAYGLYTAIYPLHTSQKPRTVSSDAGKQKPSAISYKLRKRLDDEWANFRSIWRFQPLSSIRDYFGEKISFYFAFVEMYTLMLLLPAVASVLMLVYGFLYANVEPELANVCMSPKKRDYPDEPQEQPVRPHNVAEQWMCPICAPPGCDAWKMHQNCAQFTLNYMLDNPMSLILGSLVMLWSVLFHKLWKRKEIRLAVDWDCEDAAEHDVVIRPDYEQRAVRSRRNPITLESEPLVPGWNTCLRRTVSIFMTAFVLCIVILMLSALVVSRIFLYGEFKLLFKISGKLSIEITRWLVHAAIFVVVFISERFYTCLAARLTTFECQRTDSDFFRSLQWKLFIFYMLNDFIPILYASFVRGKVARTPLHLILFTEMCDAGCLLEVTELVAVLLILRLIVGNAYAMIMPYLRRKAAARVRKQQNSTNTGPQMVLDYDLQPSEWDGVYEQFMEAMVQFAFVVLLTTAFPATPIVCLINNMLATRIYAINLMQNVRRPVPIRVPGIQIWNTFLDMIIKVGVVFNAATMAYTGEVVPRLYYKYFVSMDEQYTGYGRFSISTFNVSLWTKDQLAAMKKMNITQCAYFGLYQPLSDVPREDFWRVMFLRTAAFAVLILFYSSFMWLVKVCINDVPEDVRNKIRRREYLVNKSNEAYEISLALQGDKGGFKWMDLVQFLGKDLLKGLF